MMKRTLKVRLIMAAPRREPLSVDHSIRGKTSN
jgi:hypothetical protein